MASAVPPEEAGPLRSSPPPPDVEPELREADPIPAALTEPPPSVAPPSAAPKTPTPAPSSARPFSTRRPLKTPTPPLIGAPAAPRGSDPPRSTPYPMGDGPPASQSLQRPPITAHLSPRMTAIFGGLFGLATVTSIIALLIQSVPPKDERALAASAAPTASASAHAAKPEAVSKKPKRTPIPGPWRLSELSKDPGVFIETATMDRKGFVDALSEKSVPKAQAYRIMKAFEGVRKFDKSNRHDKFSVAMERGTKKVKAFEYEVSPSEIYQARESDNGLLAGAKLDMKIADDEIQGSFYVSSDLTASYDAGGFEEGILPALDEALGSRMSTDAFEEGGTVRAIAIEETALGMFSHYKRIVALEYRPPDPAGKVVRIYNFNGEEARGYFDERGKQPNAAGWQAPIAGAPVTSRFNPTRMHPVLHKIMPHEGTDFGAPMGAPIYTAYRGVVLSIGPRGPCGNAVEIQHANGITTGYCHMSRFAAGLKAGDKVGTHQLVGYVGATGRATGPHLHFFAKKNGKFFDAETLLVLTERVIPGVDRPGFLQTKTELDKRLDAIPLPEPPAEKPKPAPAPASSAPASPPDSSLPSGPPPNGSPSSAQPADHAFVEDDGDDDDVKGEPIAGPSLSGAPMGPAPPLPSGKPKAGKP